MIQVSPEGDLTDCSNKKYAQGDPIRPNRRGEGNVTIEANLGGI